MKVVDRATGEYCDKFALFLNACIQNITFDNGKFAKWATVFQKIKLNIYNNVRIKLKGGSRKRKNAYKVLKSENKVSVFS